MAEELAVLVSRCLDGDQFSFGKLIDRFRGRVYGLCYSMLRQREDAEDAVQETFVRVARNLHRWDPQRAFEPWLLTIAGNRCRTRLSRRRNRPAPLSLEIPVADDSHLEMQGQLMAEEINLALQAIRTEYRVAFEMFHNAEASYAEIAEQMQVPLGTVKTWVHRARKEVVEILKNRGVLEENAGGRQH